MPRLGERANRSSIRRVTLRPTASETRPPAADQNSAPQRKPRRGGSAVSTGTGNVTGSVSVTIRTVCGFDLQPTDEPQTFTNRDGRKYQMAKMKKTADCKVCCGVARASR